MKNFLYLLLLPLTLTVGAQQTDLLADFEPTGSDVTLSNWNSELQSTTVANPQFDGVNSSGYVAQLIMISDAQQVAGVNAISGFYNANDNNANDSPSTPSTMAAPNTITTTPHTALTSRQH